MLNFDESECAAMEDSLGTAIFEYSFYLFLFVLYGLPIAGLIAGSVAAIKSHGKKRWGIVLAAFSGLCLAALIFNVVSSGIKYGF
jgi:hypothetical protein